MLDKSNVVTAFKTVATKELSQAETMKALVPFICGGVLVGIEILLVVQIYKSVKEIIQKVKERE